MFDNVARRTRRILDTGPMIARPMDATIESMAIFSTSPRAGVRPPSSRTRAIGRGSARRLSQVTETLRGRAWINGREVGGPDPRFAHLARSYD